MLFRVFLLSGESIGPLADSRASILLVRRSGDTSSRTKTRDHPVVAPPGAPASWLGLANTIWCRSASFFSKSDALTLEELLKWFHIPGLGLAIIDDFRAAVAGTRSLASLSAIPAIMDNSGWVPHPPRAPAP